jgi:hypothetical protein
MTDIKNVEIFAEGVWNGNPITAQVLKNIVDSFQKTKEFYEPPLKLGHGNKQELLKQEGLPAAGWISDLRIEGKKLLADFANIPKKVADLIKNKRYRKVSIELFRGLKLKGQELPHFLGAVALLGADIPAVLTLDDIPTDFKSKANFTCEADVSNMSVDTYQTEIEKDVQNMSTKDNEQGKKDQTKQDYSKTIDAQSKEIEDLKKQNESLQNYKKENDKRLIDLEIANQKAEIDKFSMQLEKQELLSPSMKPLVEQLIEKTGKHEFSHGDKKIDTFGVVTEILKLAKECYKINFSEHTKNEDNVDASSFTKQNEKIEKYARENNIPYADAYKALQKQA